MKMLGKDKNYIKINKARIAGREEASGVYRDEIKKLKEEIKDNVKKETDEFYISVNKNISESLKRENALQNRFNEALINKEVQFKSELKELDNSHKVLLESLKKSLSSKEEEYVRKINILDDIIKENEQLRFKLKEMLQEFSLIVSSRDIKLSAALKQISLVLHEDRESLGMMSGKYTKLDAAASSIKRLTIN